MANQTKIEVGRVAIDQTNDPLQPSYVYNTIHAHSKHTTRAHYAHTRAHALTHDT